MQGEVNNGRCPACGKKNGYQYDGLCVVCYKRFLGRIKTAESWILEYHERKTSYIESLQEFSDLSATKITDEPRAHTTSSPTEIKAMRIADISNQGLWIIAVEDTLRRLDDRKRKFIAYRQEAEILAGQGRKSKGRPPWVDDVLGLYAKAGEKAPDRQSMFTWWREVRSTVIQMAGMYKCL